jgi:hypothetical protein
MPGTIYTIQVPDLTHELVNTYGPGNWLPHMLAQYQPPDYDAQLRTTILGLIDFVRKEAVAGHEENIIWAVKEIIRIAN